MPLTITRIPEPYRHGLAKIKTLSIETVIAIVEALEKAAPTSTPKELASISEQAGGLTHEEATNIISSLRSLLIFRAMAECTVSDLVKMLISAMQTTGGSLAISEEEDENVLADKLSRLLNLNSLALASNVEQLKADHPSIFFDAKILTDIRPVFEKPGDRPIGGIITNTLKVVSHEGGEHKELYFALDAEDVMTLKKTAERALEN